MGKLKIQTVLSIMFISGLFLSGCNDKQVYKEIQNMPNKSWTKENVLTFKPNMEADKQKHHIQLLVRHIYGFALTEFQIHTEIETPSGKQIEKTITAEVMDEKREYKSDCLGDYCDLEVSVYDNFTFEETGVYTFKFTQLADLNPLPYILDIGLLIQKTEKHE